MTLTYKPTFDPTTKPRTVQVPNHAVADSTSFSPSTAHVTPQFTPSRPIEVDAWNFIAISADYHQRLADAANHFKPDWAERAHFAVAWQSVQTDAIARVTAFGLHAVAEESDDEGATGQLIQLPSTVIPEGDDA